MNTTNNNDETMPDVAAVAATMTMESSTSAATAEIAVVDMGYEDCAPMVRRGSMTQKERRASIQAVMADPALTPMTKRRSIQHLMDGRRHSATGNYSQPPPTQSTTCTTLLSSMYDTSRTNSLVSTSGTTSTTTTARTTSLDMTMETAGSSYEDGSGGGGGGSSSMEYEPDSDPTKPSTIAPATGIVAFMRGVGGIINNEQTRQAELTRPHCSHYERNCTMIAPCCGGAFGCRICHDECPNLPPKINNGGKRYHRSASLPGSFTNLAPSNNNINSTTTTPYATAQSSIPEDNHHAIDRHAVAEVICRHCYTRQSSKTNACVACHVPFGAYHCIICNLWMANDERPYHCADCGFCRVGGHDNFRHCMVCGMCIDRTLYTNHNCKAGKYRSNCPVCQEYLFNSRGASHEMPCGHAIHWDCFRQLAAHDSRCPICKKTAETRERMLPTWHAMASAVALQPVPRELSRVVTLSCNDCEVLQDGMAWHYLGMQCGHCSSFNTVVDRIILKGEEAYQFLQEKAQQLASTSAAATTTDSNAESSAAPLGDGQPRRPGGQARHRVNRRRSVL